MGKMAPDSSAASSPSLASCVNSLGWSWRPWKKRTVPETRRRSPFWITRSRNGCPGQEHSISPDESRMTAWKMRSPLRVGITPLDTTRPMTFASIPGSSAAMRWMVEASS